MSSQRSKEDWIEGQWNISHQGKTVTFFCWWKFETGTILNSSALLVANSIYDPANICRHKNEPRQFGVIRDYQQMNVWPISRVNSQEIFKMKKANWKYGKTVGDDCRIVVSKVFHGSLVKVVTPFSIFFSIQCEFCIFATILESS